MHCQLNRPKTPVYLYMKVIEWQLQVLPKKKERGEKNNLIPSETYKNRHQKMI